MNISFMQALMVGVVCWLAHSAVLGYSICGSMWSPIVLGFPVGLIIGNVPEAMKVAACVQLPYLGITGAGLALPSDAILAGTVGTALAVLTGVSPQTAVTLAVPIGLLGILLHQVRMGTNAIWQHMMDQYAEKGDGSKFFLLHVILPQATLFVLYGIPTFLAVYYGNTAVQALLNAIPERLMHSLEVIGGMMPAVGIALSMRVIGKKSILPYFFVGFLLTQYMNLGILPVAVLATCIAFINLELKGGLNNAN
ncbi:PTS mannose/fructose/sorbose/N-acetylgalactosamine transporter subunit IIC [Tepidanaerobacter acetatoxydans]|uniref:PTS mannose/fructose/sorbose/N-acetylgalactosamine transporter subunit IIC n=1 Tax=Tepidanaerobacter acetatoxydans TaxID=499229 RepID=UPI001BD36C4E|nr:PTS sugar transporter subunit IIC [Tepidanaerobacter acetatoxydans]